MSVQSDERDEEASLELLLREVGARDLPDDDVASQVREAVHAEWLSVVAERKRHTQRIGFGVAAGLFALAVGAVLFGTYRGGPTTSSALVASITKIHRDAQVGVVQLSADRGANWRDAAVGEQLTAGTMLRTDAATVAALDFGSGLSVRMDRGSLLQFVSFDSTQLERGGAYVDASGEHSGKLILVTRFGTIAHLGTQYQAYVSTNRLRVSVREGRVAIADGRTSTEAASGEQVEVGEQGEVTRTPISSFDDSWQWASQAAPTFDIERRALTDFLEWVGRETGRAVEYATPEVRRQAEDMILRGSIANLTPEQALAAVLATTSFVHSTQGAKINISL